MENQINKETIDVNCNKLKLGFYNCLKNQDPSIGEEMRFMAKSKLNNIDKYKIDAKFLSNCNNPQLISCLNDKYRLKKIEEGPLMQLFSEEYDKIMEKISKKINKTDFPNKNQN